MAHIAWLGKKSPFCGNVSYGLSTTLELKKRGHQISFIHFDNPINKTNLETSLVANDPEVSLPYLIKSQVYTIPSPRAQRELRESLERLRPDLIHASLTLSPLDFRLPELCNQINVPLIATFHPAFDAKIRNLTASTQQLTYQLYAPSLARYDKVIVFSEKQAEVLSKLGVKESRLTIIPNGVDPNKWIPYDKSISNSKKVEVLERLGNKRTFLYMGRIATEKNVEALLKAWKLINTNGCQLVIVGDGPLRPTLENNFISRNEIIWWGYEADFQTKLSLLQCAEVFILPSLVEGLSIALLEAMATGTACIATDAGADGEVLEGGAGIVLNTENVTSQLKTLLPVLKEHPSLTKELGNRARQRVLEQYTLTKNVDSLEFLYNSIIGIAEPASIKKVPDYVQQKEQQLQSKPSEVLPSLGDARQ